MAKAAVPEVAGGDGEGSGAGAGLAVEGIHGAGAT